MGATQSFELNIEQATAVAAGAGPVLVIAGAGTGKTRVIVERINRLINAGTVPKRLLALTFTEKAASEMLDRVNETRGTFELDMPVMTFNAYGESMLRRFAADIGLSRSFTVLSESSQIVFLRERIDELGLDYFAPVTRPDGLLNDIANYFSQLKQTVITPERYHTHASAMPSGDAAEKLERTKHLELANAYAAYLRLSREANVIDYDDQIYLLIQLFLARPNVLKSVQESYDYIMVDEFQDTNGMQSTLVDLIAGKRQNLFVVGDDDQSIYGWRGATLANILSFKVRYPETTEITLLQNYRSSQQILDSAYQLITNNNPHRLETQLQINKQLISDKSGHAPSVHSFETLDEELQWIAEDISHRLEQGTAPGEIAILARRNATIQKLHTHLEYAGVEHVVIGQRYELYHEPAIRILLEAIKATVDPLDNTSLYNTLTGPLFGLSPTLIGEVASLARREHQSLRGAIYDSEEPDLQPAKDALERVKQWRELSGTATIGKLAYEIIDSTGYKDRLYADPSSAVAGTRLSELFATFKEFEYIALQPTAVQYVQALPALQAAGDGGEDDTLDLSSQRVNILSIHKAKGLEWPIVYIADCTEGSFPLREMSRGIAMPDGLSAAHHSEADEHMYEERRLMYVAMTRARDELILTHAERHSGNSTRKPSRFLREAFGDSEPSHQKPSAVVQPINIGSFNLPPSDEIAIPQRMLKNDYVTLSISQAIKYMSCPLDFYYSYILNVPQEPEITLQYGSVMHSLVEDINRSLVTGKLVDFELLEKHLATDWPKYGYLSATQRDRAFQQAQQTLTDVYHRVSEVPRIPVAIEEPFMIKLDDCKLTINGRFDAVFPLGNTVEIVDYKTSTAVNTPEKAKQRASASEQLTLYALAWQLMHDELPALVTLDFIDTGQVGSLKKTQRGIDSAKARLQKVADGIRAKNFAPGRDHLFCIHPPII